MSGSNAVGPTRIGIQDLAIATGHHVLDLDDLAAASGVDPAKYHVGIGQDTFSVPAADEDVVTIAATAAAELLARTGTDGIRTVFFATETGVDQSKSAGMFVHGLLGLPSSCRVVEFKQACYGGTAALQAAIGIVARDPRERVLVIASDVARYDLESAAEPTQGAGAVAMLVAADPDLVELESVSGLYSADVDDFWRPNDRSTALVEGRLSVSAYVDAYLGAWDDLVSRGGPGIAEIDRYVHHQPFTKMALKAQRRFAKHTGLAFEDADLALGMTYNRRTGNTYTASLFFALAALLDLDDDLAGRRVAMFSYGSGSVGELMTGVVAPGYREVRRAERERTAAMLDDRVPIDVRSYRELHATTVTGSVDTERPRVTTAPFRFAGVRGGARRYERTTEG
ncbi:hydroxymethylglutaryl-CoA synthase [Curtobacterium sp. Leaf261]|uniref:hydroxymethylglutaryl-CoA synthase n=1 Tax=Curtobacterium sp. Leaf261 TaxID=1736311 RepID=UPI0006FDF751|nr:hydroxymethylglutaryl-CoA synthase [Curtobacterium sp. Leaf261]KQO64983.1 hydroxymethylglutaryl-CoA synthase [Curtobacterium sp. Leaf261]